MGFVDCKKSKEQHLPYALTCALTKIIQELDLKGKKTEREA